MYSAWLRSTGFTVCKRQNDSCQRVLLTSFPLLDLNEVSQGLPLLSLFFHIYLKYGIFEFYLIQFNAKGMVLMKGQVLWMWGFNSQRPLINKCVCHWRWALTFLISHYIDFSNGMFPLCSPVHPDYVVLPAGGSNGNVQWDEMKPLWDSAISLIQTSWGQIAFEFCSFC